MNYILYISSVCTWAWTRSVGDWLDTEGKRLDHVEAGLYTVETSPGANNSNQCQTYHNDHRSSTSNNFGSLKLKRPWESWNISNTSILQRTSSACTATFRMHWKQMSVLYLPYSIFYLSHHIPSSVMSNFLEELWIPTVSQCPVCSSFQARRCAHYITLQHVTTLPRWMIVLSCSISIHSLPHCYLGRP